MRWPAFDPNHFAIFAAACGLHGMACSLSAWTHYGLSRETIEDTGVLASLVLAAGTPTYFILTGVEQATRGITAARRALALAGALALAAGLGGLLFGMVSVYESAVKDVVRYCLWYLKMGALLLAALLLWRWQAEAARRATEEEVARLETRRDADELRLRQLRNQIEPHFLINTLASAKELARRDTVAARGMLRDLADYLAIALSGVRMASRVVRDELELARVYLEILAVRMDGRLRVEIDVPDDLRDAPMPPLVLLTLVENAIKHGISPRDVGGRIQVSLRRQDGDLVVRVADDGRGFSGQSGTGIGLANTRARLAALYGGKAALDLGANPGGGVVATLRVPLEA